MILREQLRELIRAACILEARARKPGNVHPGAAFDDLCYDDFVRSAEAVAQVLPDASVLGVGRAVLKAVQRTRELVNRPTNPNLGIILLLAPLAAVPAEVSLKAGIAQVLDGLTVEDSRLVYQAIGLANPGGMGQVDEADVTESPAITLLEAMRLAAGRDSIAAEYVTGFQIVLGTGVPFLKDWDWTTFVKSSSTLDGGPPQGGTTNSEERGPPVLLDWEGAIIHLQLTLMSRFPDTLIARKCGRELADESAVRTGKALDAGGIKTEPGRQLLGQLDAWLRADGHRRNPGTTADLIAASLFAAARDDKIVLHAATNETFAVPIPASKRLIDDRERYRISCSADRENGQNNQ